MIGILVWFWNTNIFCQKEYNVELNRREKWRLILSIPQEEMEDSDGKLQNWDPTSELGDDEYDKDAMEDIVQHV